MANSDERAEELLREHEELEQLAQASLAVPREPSKVPLADGDGFAVRPQPAAVASPAPVHDPSPPTGAQINAKIVKQIAKQNATRALKHAHASAASVAKAQKAFKKAAEDTPQMAAEKEEICDWMNRAREMYAAQLPTYKWKKSYTPDKFSLPQLQREKALVKSLISQIGVKPGLRVATTWILALMENILLTCKVQTALGMGLNAQSAAQQGYFDPEIDGLILEYADRFQLGPIGAYVMKLGMFAQQVHAHNSSASTARGQSKSFREEHADL